MDIAGTSGGARGILHDRNDAQPGTTSGTGADREAEHAAQQRGPGSSALGRSPRPSVTTSRSACRKAPWSGGQIPL